MSGNEKIAEPNEICKYCNNFFINIGPNLAKNIKACPGKDYSHFLGEIIVNLMYLNPITEDEILNVVSKFWNKHSYGYDDINIVFVKKSIQSIVKPLSCL